MHNPLPLASQLFTVRDRMSTLASQIKVGNIVQLRRLPDEQWWTSLINSLPFFWF